MEGAGWVYKVESGKTRELRLEGRDSKTREVSLGWRAIIKEIWEQFTGA